MIAIRYHHLTFLLFISAFFMILYPHQVEAQTSNQNLISLFTQSSQEEVYIQKDTPLTTALDKIKKDYNVIFLYESGILKQKKVSRQVVNEGLIGLLKALLRDTNLAYKKLGERTFGIVKKGEQQMVAHEVTGTITDGANGTPLPGANVVVKNTTIGTSTNTEGHYSLSAPAANDTLVFTFVGYQKQEIPIDGQTVINVTLEPRALSGKEVVVVGYGTQRLRNITGSISTIRAEEFNNTSDVSVGQILQGKAAGVTVTNNSGTPGGAVSVRIRGITSITGNNEPLYVIDGVPVSGDANNTSTSGRSVAPNYSGQGSNTVSPLSGINPNDIESITILKDASATAIYGSRGANGVVIITTKGGRTGQSKISYNGYIGSQQPMKLLDMMELQEYARLTNYITELSGIQANPAFSRPEILGSGTNWQEAIFQDAFMQNHQLAFSGGNNKLTYYISGGYLNKDGIMLGSRFKRYTLKTNIDAEITDWLNMGARINGSTSDQNLPINGSATGAVNLALTQSPAIAVYNADGSFAGPTTDANGNIIGHTNPVARALSVTNSLDRNKFLGNLFTEVQITDFLTFKSAFGGNIQKVSSQQFTPTYERGANQNATARAFEGRQTYTYWVWKNYFTFKNTFADKHNVTFLLGQEAQKNTWEGISARAQGFLTNNLHTLNLAEPTTSSAFAGGYTLASYYGRLIYSFDDKYGLNATLRADGSSKFEEGNRWGYFPSLSASWKIYMEPFMKGFNQYVDKLTLKVGYGITGNQGIGNFLYSSNLRPIATGLGKGFAISNISNPDLQWEEQRQLNLGLSFSLFNNRLSVDVEGYNKISDKFLFTLPLPTYLTGGPAYQGGINPPTVNLGKMQNRGIEATLRFRTISSKDFSWNSTLTISHFKNKVWTCNKKVDRGLR